MKFRSAIDAFVRGRGWVEAVSLQPSAYSYPPREKVGCESIWSFGTVLMCSLLSRGWEVFGSLPKTSAQFRETNPGRTVFGSFSYTRLISEVGE